MITYCTSIRTKKNKNFGPCIRAIFHTYSYYNLVARLFPLYLNECFLINLFWWCLQLYVLDPVLDINLSIKLKYHLIFSFTNMISAFLKLLSQTNIYCSSMSLPPIHSCFPFNVGSSGRLRISLNL